MHKGKSCHNLELPPLIHPGRGLFLFQGQPLHAILHNQAYRGLSETANV